MGFKNKTYKQIEKNAYDMYHTAGKDHDKWCEIRDMFLYLLENAEDDDAKGYWNNTLGYIYYYGRCNDDWAPEYEKAFNCFSIGAEYGIRESKYKLGDMYMKGLFVDKDESVAVKYYLEVFKEIEPHFRKEKFRGEFADIALRLGGMYKNGIGCEKDERKALFILTMADYAIKERMRQEDFFGNQKVADSITKELTELQEKLCIKETDNIEADYPIALPLVCSDGQNGIMEFNVCGDKVILVGTRFDIIRKLSKGEKEDYFDVVDNLVIDYTSPRIPVIFSEYGFCDFFDEIVETAEGVEEFNVNGDQKDYFPFDEIRYDSSSGRYNFMYNDKVRAYIKAKKFVFEM